MPHLAVALLGPFQVTLDGAPVNSFESARVRALLAFLAAEAGYVHTREALAELFWPEQSPGVALANLRHSLANLRKSIADATAQPPFLKVTQTTIQFNLAGDTQVDLLDFTAYLQHVASAPTADCQAALALRRGAFLAGLNLQGSPQFEEWLAVVSEQVNHLAGQALARLAGDCVARDDIAQATTWTRQRLALEPWNEEVHQQLIWQLATSGQHAAALHHFEICRRALAKELGVEPQPATQALVDRIRRGEPTAMPGDQTHTSPAPVTGSLPGSGKLHLPPRPPIFLGRTAVIEQVAERLENPDCRLLTVLGPGGMGKTLLAVEVARRQGDRFPDGVWFVDLAPVNAPEELVGAILRSLDLPLAGPEAAIGRLLAHLETRQLLLVLDNFEHLIAGAELLTPLLNGAPGIKLLVTSRTRLHLAEEWLLPLGGLATPPGNPVGNDAGGAPRSNGTEDLSSYASVQLFLQRVQRLDPGFRPEPADLERIGEICRLLEGMPLAVDLAAAWVRSLTLAEIAAAVSGQLALFTTTLRDIPTRHRSMHAVFDRSWRLLDAHDRSLLRQLAVFRGGCTLAAATAITGASPADMESLVDKSWLRVRTQRFALHELMRQFCAEKLDQEHAAETGEAPAAVEHRHCSYYAAMTSAEEHLINWKRQTMEILSADFGNLEAAWRWALARGDFEAIRQMVTGFYHIALMTGWIGALLPFFEQAAASVRTRWRQASDDETERDRAARLLAHIAWVQANLFIHPHQLVRTRECLDEMEALLATIAQDDQWQEYHVWRRDVFAVYLHQMGDFEGARAEEASLLAFLQSHDLVLWPWRPEIGSRFWQMHAHAGLGFMARLLGEYDTAQLHDEASIRLSDEIGEQRFKAHRLNELANLLRLRGELPQALSMAQQALVLSRGFEDRFNVAFTELNLALIAIDMGDVALADEHLGHSLAVARETGQHTLHLRTLVALASLARFRGRFAAAREWLDEATSAFDQPGVTHSNCRAAVALQLGHLACAEHDWPMARQHYAEALSARGCDAADVQNARAGLAVVAWAENDWAQAEQLLTAVIGDPATSNLTRHRANEFLKQRNPAAVVVGHGWIVATVA